MNQVICSTGGRLAWSARSEGNICFYAWLQNILADSFRLDKVEHLLLFLLNHLILCLDLDL